MIRIGTQQVFHDADMALDRRKHQGRNTAAFDRAALDGNWHTGFARQVHVAPPGYEGTDGLKMPV